MKNLLLPIFFCFLYVLTSAATYTVTSSNDSGTGTLREAITLANANPAIPHTINIAPSVFLITLSSTIPPLNEANLSDLKDVTLNGDGVVIVSSTDSFFATLRENVTINDVSFSGFRYGCLSVHPIDLGMVTIANCNFNDCTSVSGEAYPAGGAILQYDGELLVLNCSFTNCDAFFGGAIFIDLNNPDNTTIDACTFDNNTVVNQGRAIYLHCGNNLNLAGICDFKPNPDQDIYRAPAEGCPTISSVTFLPTFGMALGSILVIN